MGLDNASVKFCCAAKSSGVDFRNSLFIGRQSLSPDEDVLQRVFAVQGIDARASELLANHRYGEEFFSLLGATDVKSLDYSNYEDATFIHDLNSPVPEELKGKFSVVYDGGTIEHVFNVPQALKNCMEMVEVGGHFLQVNAANNYMGHGFWQFSPELLFRVFSPVNGFKTEAVLLHEVAPRGRWYSVKDPDSVHSRVVLCNRKPTYILTIAKKVSTAEVFRTTPMQSDYSKLWEESALERADFDSRTKPGMRPVGNARERFSLKRFLPEPVKQPLRLLAKKIKDPMKGLAFSKPYYRVVSEDCLLRGKLGSDEPES